MPKKEALPEIEDDSKFLVVHYAYPPLAQVAERKPDRIAMAQWVASCVGQEYVISFYTRKTSANKVLVEISKQCPKINNFLGEHKWREFLRDCPSEDLDRTSKVFYCKHNTSRMVKEQGWRAFIIEDSFFKDFDVKNSTFSYPYPATSWCDVPESIHKDDTVCRPLPVSVFGRRPKPEPAMPLVPGSDAYYKSKASGNTNSGRVGAPAASPASAPVRAPMQWSKVVSGAKSDNSKKPPDSPTTTKGNQAPSFPTVSNLPGLERNSSGTGSSLSETSDPEEEENWPITANAITVGLAETSISDVRVAGSSEDGNNNDEEEGSYWSQQPDRPDTWKDKPWCPEHQWSCRRGICRVLDRIEREKEKQARTQYGNEWDGDGFQRVAKTTRGGRGNRGRGRGRGNNRARGW